MKRIILLIVLFAPSAFTRVHDMGKESFATYIKANMGTSMVAKSAFKDSSGVITSFEDSVAYNYGGEFGMLFSMGRVVLRLSGDVVKPKQLSEIPGKAPNGIDLMTLRSDVLAITPKLTLEYSLGIGTGYRTFIAAGAGVSVVTIENEYKLNAFGSGAYGIGDFVEQGTAYAMLYEGSMGVEFFFADNATLLLDAGYRQLVADEFKHTRTATTFLGNVTPGSNMMNANRTKRTVDLSGPWAGLGFRFYL